MPNWIYLVARWLVYVVIAIALSRMIDDALEPHIMVGAIISCALGFTAGVLALRHWKEKRDV